MVGGVRVAGTEGAPAKRRQRRGGRLRRLTAAVLLALAAGFAGALPGTAGPARADVLVSNIGQAGERRGFMFYIDQAQGFWTGSRAGGYTVTNVEIRFANESPQTAPTVTLRRWKPDGRLVATLSGSANVSDGIATFTAPANTMLDPGIRYFVVVVGGGDDAKTAWTASTDEDPGGRAGWSVGNNSRVRNAGSNQSWREPVADAMLKIRVNGSDPSGKTVSTDEDRPYTFGTSDFEHSGAGTGDTLSSVKIATLPSVGELSLDGAAVTANRSVSKADIDAGKLVFTPAANAHGAPYASFAYKLTYGTSENAATHTMVVDVTSVTEPATGAPTVSGTAEAGGELTADVSRVADGDGLPAMFDYRWIRVDGANETDIAGATSTTYRLTPDDEGRKVRFRARFTDREGNAEALTSDAWPETGTVQAPGGSNAAPTAANGTVTATEDTEYVFQAGDFGFSDTDSGDELVGVKIVTLPSAGSLAVAGTAVASGQWVPKVDIDAGRLVFTPAANANGASHASFTFKVSDGPAASAAAHTMTVDVTQVNDAATGAPTIIGAALVGQTLRASTAGIADIDGLPDTYSFQWGRVDGRNLTEIPQATSSSYTLTSEDEGRWIAVKVSFTDSAGNAERTASFPSIGVVLAPTSSDNTVTTSENTRYTFTAEDFGFDQYLSLMVNQVEIVMLPTAGRLEFGGRALVAYGKAVLRLHINDGQLVFVPETNETGNPYSSFAFRLTHSVLDDQRTDVRTMTIGVTSPNNQPTGKPTISGTAEVGFTLTASTNGIADLDGLPGTFGYRWIRVDSMTEADIEGATSSTYILTPDDEGKTIKVAVSFTDGNGTDESLTSEATGQVAATNRPTAAHGKVTVDEDASYTFGAGDFGFSGVNAGDTLASVKIATLPSDGTLELDGAGVTVGASVTKTDIDADKLVFTPAANGNGAPYASFTFKVNDGTRDSLSAYRMAIGVTPVSDAATGQPTVTGKAQVGHVLIADRGGIVDVDGLPLGFTYQWIGVAGEIEANIPGATARAYKLTASDRGKTIKVKVSFTDLGGGAESATSGETAEVAAPAGSACNTPDFGTRTPIWTGTVTVGNYSRGYFFGYLSGVVGELDNAQLRVGSDKHVIEALYVLGSTSPAPGRLDFETGPRFSNSLQASGLALHVCDVSYRLADADFDADYEFYYWSSAGLDWSSVPERTVYLSVPANIPQTSTPTISGSAEVGGTLTASVPEDIDRNDFYGDVFLGPVSYRWLRVAGETETVIPGAASDTYVVRAEDTGKKLKVRVSFYDQVGYLEELTSAAKTVPDPFAPKFRSAVAQGTSVTLTYHKDLDTASVPAATAFAATVAGSAATLAETSAVAVSGKAVVLTLASAVSAGAAVTVRYTKPTGTGATALQDTDGNKVASDASPRVAATTPAAPGDLQAVAGHGQVTLTWEAPSSTGGAPVSGYRVRHSPGSEVTSSATWTSVGSGLTHTVTGLTNGDGYAFEVQAENRAGAGPAAKATMAPVAGACNVPDLAGRDAVWTATLTPGQHVHKGYRHTDGTVSDETIGYGFFAGTGPSSRAGRIEPHRFLVDANRVGVRDAMLYMHDEPGLELLYGYKTGTLLLSLDRALSPGEALQLVLHVCARAFALSDASYEKYSDDMHDYTWSGTGLDWSALTARTFYVSLPGTQTAPATVAPVVAALPAVTGPGDGGVYAAGERIEARVAFDAEVDVDVSQGSPTLGLALGGVRREAAYESGSGTAELVFAYTAVEADAGAAQAKAISNGIVLNGATIRGDGGADAVLDFGAAPGVASVGILDPVSGSDTGDGAWDPGEGLEVAFVFEEPVTVDTTGGTPSVDVLLGAATKQATYARGSGTDTLIFSYTLAKTDARATSVLVALDALALNGGAIRSTAGLDAGIEHAGAARTGVIRSALPLLSVADAEAAEGATLAFTVTLAPAASGEVTVDWATADGTATAGSDYTAGSGTLTFAAGETEMSVEVAATADDTEEAPETLTLTLSNPSGARLGDGEATGTVSEPGPAPLTGSFSGAPPEHDGTNAFVLNLAFSEEPDGLSYKTVRDSLFTVTGATVERARRLSPPSNERFEMTLAPVGNDAVELALAALPACGEAGSVCTADGRALAGPLGVTVPGPAALIVADASVDEGPGATLDFAVTLDRERHAAVTVDYATSDGTATAGSDYTAASGTLTFAAGETSKTVSVAVLDDSHDEGSETMTLTLSNASGARIADGEATGTIENSDAMPKAWLARFGRTVASQVLDAVESRLAASRSPGAEVSVAGQRIDVASPGERSALEEREAQVRLDALSDWLRNDDPDGNRIGTRAVTARELLTGSSFALTGGSAETGFGALWGRGAVSRFDGRDGELTLDGEVTSAMLGADFTRGRATAGLMLSHSRGEGGYRSPAGGGAVESSVTGLYPWGSYAVNERLSVWAVAGFGEGTLALTPEGAGRIETDMALAMGAFGLRGVLIEPAEAGGVELSVKTDAMGVRTTSEAARGADGGNMAGAEGEVTRLRLGLEATWHGVAAGGGVLTPSVEVGVRRDGGDAETGYGADIGAGLSWSHPERGIAAEVRGRGLLSHEADGFGESGFSGTVSFDPEPDSERGLSFALTQTVGASASGGADALLGRRHLEGLAANDPGSGSGAGGNDDLKSRRLELKLGYGFSALGDRFTMTPEVGAGFSDTGRDYSLGWRLVRRSSGGDIGSLELAVEATRRESANDNGQAEHAFGARLTARW